MSEGPFVSARSMTIVLVMVLLALSAHGKDKGRVYRCEIGGKITFSDSACEKAPDKKAVAVDSLNGGSVTTAKGTTTIQVPTASKPPPSVQSKPVVIRPDSVRADRAPEQRADQKIRCKDISVQLDAVAKRLRDGNGMRDMGESMRLSDERQRLERESKNLKCA